MKGLLLIHHFGFVSSDQFTCAAFSVPARLPMGSVPNCISQTALVYSRNGDMGKVLLTLVPEEGSTVPHSGVVAVLIGIQFPATLHNSVQAGCLFLSRTLSVGNRLSSSSEHVTIPCVPPPPLPA